MPGGEISLGEKRTAQYAVYVHAITEYLSEPTPEREQAVVDAARRYDALIGNDYFFANCEQTHESYQVRNMLNDLKNGDTAMWTAVLSNLDGHPAYRELYPFSPMGKKNA